MRTLCLLCLLCLLLVNLWPMSHATAQEVERGSLSGYGLSLRRFRVAAEKQGRSQWPDPRNGKPGTQALLTFDPRNADLTLATPLEFGAERLLTESRGIARTTDLPLTDFITLQGRSTAAVDLEFNDYLQRGGMRSAFSLDLHRLRTALEQSSLPRPIILAIDVDSMAQTRLAHNGTVRRLEEVTFLNLDDIPPGMQLHFEARATPVGIVVGLLLGGLFLFPVATMARYGRRADPPAADPEPPSPEEVQKQYDRQSPLWITRLGFLVIPVVLAGGDFFPQAFTTWEVLLPLPFLWGLIGAGGIATVFGVVNVLLFRRREAARETARPNEPAEDRPIAAPDWLIGLIGFPFLIAATLFWPIYTPEGLVLRRNYIFGLLGLLPVYLLVMGIRSFRAGRQTLNDGPWHAMVHELAALGKIRVKHVVLVRAKEANAFATAFGTVGLTTGLIEGLAPEEVRAIAAHEVAHLKLGHPQRTLFLTLTATVALLAAWGALEAALRDSLPLSMRALLQSPIFAIFLLPLLRAALIGRGMRAREHAADCLAVQWIGDPELAIRAIERVHHLNEVPGRLKPSDEAVSAHPSLVRRIEAIRALQQD